MAMICFNLIKLFYVYEFTVLSLSGFLHLIAFCTRSFVLNKAGLPVADQWQLTGQWTYTNAFQNVT